LKKVLIIENDIDTLDVLSIALEYNGYTVVSSETKISLLQIAEINPDIVAIDYKLDDGYGNDLCLDIKSNPATSRIPVILFSASLHLEKIIENCHADAFLAKPFDLQDFEKTVDDLAV
jgi:DNA-binding response OmpR family regulator